ncbi:hypothetical protein [Streptomyces mayteni]
MDAYATSRLVRHDLGDRIVLLNRRRAFAWTTLVVDDPLELAAFRLLEQPRSPKALTRRLGELFPDADVEAAVPELLAAWCALGLLYADAGQYVHVAPAPVNDEVLRLGFMRNVVTAPTAPTDRKPAPLPA